VSDNGWRAHPTWNMGALDAPEFWMTRELPDGWRIHVLLVTTGQRTVIGELRVEPGESPHLLGMRGRIDLPTGDPRHPQWQRVTLQTARREASTTLHELLTQMHRTSREIEAAEQRGEPPRRGDSLEHHLAVTAQLRGFTTTGTASRRRRPRGRKDLDLAIIAAAYASARVDQPSHPREGTQDRLQQIGVYYARSSIGPLIAKARTAHMLTPAHRGKAAGDLTPNARQLLTTANFQAPWYPPPS
jgi:hypothetical protein